MFKDSDSQRISCPTCSQITTLPKEASVKDLKPNYELRDIVAKFQGEFLLSIGWYNLDKKSPQCSNECGKEATFDCVKCDGCYCGECFDNIHSIAALRKHEKHPLGQVTKMKLCQGNYFSCISTYLFITILRTRRRIEVGMQGMQ